ncbi:hypothetical protein ASD37_16320 [Mycobacterium sp. Root135]|uniref:hypothetical protein n=1 Tax=Mycobacterium sp. Root135 TaxID=1736457 RepID=UPI0006F9381C|nr:hypothetical protein [Mycobacterium sp. Root135]KQY05934.1 hypothetical protein ASD37_16320 [Mycobacterium sp. Root135]
MTSERDMAEWDAAYLLGALSADEAADYERYLADSPESADPWDPTDLPAILDVLSPEEALALLDDGPATEKLEDVGSAPAPASFAAAAERRRTRSRGARVATALASAAAFLLIGGLVGYAVIPHQSSTGVSLQAMAPGERQGVTASLALSDEPWGTRLDWECQYTKDWAVKATGYDMVVTTKNGAETTVASWRPSGTEKQASNLAAATVIPKSDIRTVTIRESGSATPLAVTALA